MDYFPLVSIWTLWKIGNDKKVRLGEDPCVGEDEAYNISDDLIACLHDQGLFSLWDVKSPNHD
jgi:hypothetical protein